MRLIRTRFSLLILGVICLASLASSYAADRDFHEEPTNAMASNNFERILPNQVTLSNVGLFEEQMRRDLPPGSSKVAVESYLTHWSIRHSFVPPGAIYGPDGNAFFAILEDIGKRNIFTASLAIRVHLDEYENVREIVFRVDYL